MRVREAFIDIRRFGKHPSLVFVFVQFIVLNIFNYSLFFGLPSYFQNEMHLTIQTSGILMLFLSGVSMLISPVTGKWIDRSSVRQPLLAGAIFMAAGAILMTTVFIHAPIVVMAVVLAVLGISYGIMNVALQAAMLKLTPPDMIGPSSGLFQTSRYLGSILSSVVLGLVFSKAITPAHMQNLGWVLFALGIFSCAISLRLWRKIA